MNLDEQIREYCNRDDMAEEHGKDDREEHKVYELDRVVHSMHLHRLIHKAKRQQDLCMNDVLLAQAALKFFDI